MSIQRLATKAVRAAASLRGKLGISPEGAACPFDIARQLDVVVHLQDIPSLEGLYSPAGELRESAAIVLSSERPAGRQRFTCAHEIAHHVFGHGLRLDQMDDADPTLWSPEEYLADRFASALLMPKIAVESGFARRGWNAAFPADAVAVYQVARDLGVGYTTLITHLHRTLGMISTARSDELRRTRLPSLRRTIAGFSIEQDLVVADKHWGSRPIDFQVGDVVLVPESVTFEGHCADLVRRPISHLLGIGPGEGLVTLGADRAPTPARVSRRGFTGLAIYRFLEEPEYDT